ncbi:MAG TPA: T9SS type A sorting domain-containing protein, partial [Candidatus Syntrophosphaera sp.]|nr:T9SS type A sorting domain-containing protein [Candidatus Syntrophosphaera sp.]HRT60420.1 T9SS type A sorting domain-containing protein [Candidatus Syntrophosphaera sp.]
PMPQSYNYSQPVIYSVQLPYLPDSVTLRYSDNAIDVVEDFHILVSADDPVQVPAAELSCRLPNPLRGGEPVTISLSGLTKDLLSVRVYNLRGQKLGTLFEGNSAQTNLDLPWNGTMNGIGLDSGVYFLRITQGGRTANQRFVITK